MTCPQSWRGLPASLQLSQSPYSCPSFAISSQCLRNAFAMFPFGVLCRWSFPDFHGASQTSVELCSLPRSSPVFSGVLQSLPELLLVCRSSSLSAGAPPCLPEFLLVCRSCCYSLRAPFPQSSCHELAFFMFFLPYFSSILTIFIRSDLILSTPPHLFQSILLSRTW